MLAVKRSKEDQQRKRAAVTDEAVLDEVIVPQAGDIGVYAKSMLSRPSGPLFFLRRGIQSETTPSASDISNAYGKRGWR